MHKILQSYPVRFSIYVAAVGVILHQAFPAWGVTKVMPTTQPAQTAEAKLKYRESVAWKQVWVAENAELEGLNVATTTAMKDGDADAVVAAQNWVKVVRARLAWEKQWTVFPPVFHVAANSAELKPPILSLELKRNQAVASALQQADAAKIIFDNHVVRQLKLRIRMAMKSGNVNAVLADMATLKQMKTQRQQDINKRRVDAGIAVPPAVGMPFANWHQQGPVFGPGVVGNQNMQLQQSHDIGVAIPSNQWSKTVTDAMKPVAEYSIQSLDSALLQCGKAPGALIGRHVVAFLKTDRNGNFIISGSSGYVTGTDKSVRLQRLALEKGITRHFSAIRIMARARQAAEYRYQLNQLKIRYPTAMMWRVANRVAHAEGIERSAVTNEAWSQQRKDLILVARAFLPLPDRAVLVTPAGKKISAGGAVYGVIVGISSRVVQRATAPFSLPSGIEMRNSVIPGYIPPATAPLSPFLGNVAAETIAAEPIPSCTVYKIKILYCAPAPKYILVRNRKAPGPIKSYIFRLKNGTRLDATTYTVGITYYHGIWNGVPILVAKDLVVRIIPVH